MESLKIVRELNSGNFDDFISNAPIVFIDFWNDRCIPCKQIVPILDELAILYSGKIWLGKIDTDYNPVISNKYGIFQLPTFCLFKNGVFLGKISGPQTKAVYISLFDNIMKYGNEDIRNYLKMFFSGISQF